ncbi:MAG: ATP-binding protein [Anaerolineales bacterium]|jgi:serine/threonine-protein kinase RsbW
MHTKTFIGRYENLARIEKFFAEAATKAGLDSASIYAVKLAVDEACTNIIEHAYGGEDRGKIQCSYEIMEDGLRIILRDWGDSFDPSKVPEPDFSVPIEELKPRGAGVFLMKKLMDEVQFDFTTEEANVLQMVKRK